MQGKIWIAHDTHPSSIDIPVVLERGSVDAIGEYVPLDYAKHTQWNMDNECVDLVTMNQGLHHLPQLQIIEFLEEIYRVTRPGGLFIVREHDAKEPEKVKKFP